MHCRLLAWLGAVSGFSLALGQKIAAAPASAAIRVCVDVTLKTWGDPRAVLD